MDNTDEDSIPYFMWVFLYNRWIANGLLEAEKYTDVESLI